MAVATTRITNVSPQTVPILYRTIDSDESNSDVPAGAAGSMYVKAGANVTVETKRIDLGQLDRLRQLKLITYV